MEPTTLHVVVFRGSRYWVAQCLEIDLAAQSETRDALPEAFERALHAHLTMSRERGQDPLSCLPPAPDRHWDRWPEIKTERERHQDARVSSRRDLSLSFRGMNEVAFAR
jgi:hypothetical protein